MYGDVCYGVVKNKYPGLCVEIVGRRHGDINRDDG